VKEELENPTSGRHKTSKTIPI